jgi:benzoate/toluate 1,2-dioxygenase beta subunit
MPEPRTNHMISNVEILADRGDSLDVRYNFHTLSHRYKVTDHFFGSIYLTLKVMSEGSYQITRKKIVLKNDYISQVIDIYHI